VDLNFQNEVSDQFRPYNDWVHKSCVTDSDCPLNNVLKVLAGGVDTHEPCHAGRYQSLVYKFQETPWGLADGARHPPVTE
jgi:hypothetical protein